MGADDFLHRLEPITDPDEVAFLQEHIDPAAAERASDADRAYFERHPDEDEYHRAEVSGEFPPLRLPPPPAGFHWEPQVTAKALGPGVRVRSRWAALVPSGDM